MYRIYRLFRNVPLLWFVLSVSDFSLVSITVLVVVSKVR